MPILLAISHIAPVFDVQYLGDYASIEPLVNEYQMFAN